MKIFANRRAAHRRLALLLALAVFSLACDESAPTVPSAPGGPDSPEARPLPAGAVELSCAVDVREGSLECTTSSPSTPGVSALIIGGQDLNVVLTGTETVYTPGTGKFVSTVTVQNLTAQIMGTPDGMTVEGVKVFFDRAPYVVKGSGAVEVANPDGFEDFIGTEQPYFAYPGLIEPLEISAGKRWEFNVPPTVETFSFTAYISAPMAALPMELHGPVWTGTASDDWHAPANWDEGVVPEQDTNATIPSLSRLEPGASQPRLTAAGSVLHLRVGGGNELALDGRTLRVLGNVDAAGEITGGTLTLEGEETLAGGNLPAVEVSGSTRLQRPVVTTGPLVVTGSLTTDGAPLVIKVP